MTRRLYTGDHPEVARAMHNLANVLYETGRAGQAEPLLLEALAMRRRLFPGDCADTAMTLVALGAVHAARGDHAGAIPLTEEGLAMRRRVFSGDHPDLASDLYNLAVQLRYIGRREEAERAIRESIAMTGRLGAPETPELAAQMSPLGTLVRDHGDQAGLSEAAELFRRDLMIMRRTYPEGHAKIGDPLALLGGVLLKQATAESAAEAEPVLRESYDIRRASLPAGDWRVANSEASYGSAIVLGVELGPSATREASLARLREAEPLLLNGFEGLLADVQNIPPSSSAMRVGDAADSLARLYTLWHGADPGAGKEALGAQWRARAVEVRASLALPTC